MAREYIGLVVIMRMYILRKLADVIGVIFYDYYLGWKPWLMIIISVQAIKDSILHTSNDTDLSSIIVPPVISTKNLV